MKTMPTDVFEALEQEYEALEAMLESLDREAWAAPSSCPGWSVADVVLHLAQTEEGLLMSTGHSAAPGNEMSRASRRSMGTIDDVVEEWVSSERNRLPEEHFERWKAARRGCLAALLAADPDASIQWATNPLKPRTLATTRLSEHWIHANDIAEPLGVHYPDTQRIRHIAWLAHRSIPYAYARAGREDPPTVRLDLLSVDGDRLSFGPEDAECSVRGSMSELCRIAARRLVPADARTIEISGLRGDELLGLVRTYA